MPAYADPSDLQGTLPDDPETWILLASAVIDDAVLTAHYRTTHDGHPADEELRGLFRAATVAQIKYWQALGVDPTLGAAGTTGDTRVSTKSIGSASVSYDFRGAQDNVAEKTAALTAIAPAAAAILGPHARGAVIVHG